MPSDTSERSCFEYAKILIKYVFTITTMYMTRHDLNERGKCPFPSHFSPSLSLGLAHTHTHTQSEGLSPMVERERNE